MRHQNPQRAVALAMVPMALAIAGAFIDEQLHQGYSTWRSACLAAGISFTSLIAFTVQLIPTAVLGALAGGLAVQVIGVWQRRRQGAACAALAAHGGCVVGMAGALVLCASAVSLPAMLAAEFTLTAAGAWLLFSVLAPGAWQVRSKAYFGAWAPSRESAKS